MDPVFQREITLQIDSKQQHTISTGSPANGSAIDGQVGVLGLSVGCQLVNIYSVPIAILNGAHGGKVIAFFAKSKINPIDKSTNYGCLLSRLSESKLKDSKLLFGIKERLTDHSEPHRPTTLRLSLSYTHPVKTTFQR